MAGEADLRLHRCCFTGHRPEKLSETEAVISEKLEKEILQAIADGFRVFITGMARGVDIWAAEIVLRLRKEGQAIRLICACPYHGFERRWPADWRGRYNDVLRVADLIRFISPDYNPSCFQTRNEWMVDHASRVIAVYNGAPSGTKNTIEYAKKKGVSIRILSA